MKDRTGPINAEVGGEPIVLFPTEGGGTVFKPVVGGVILEFNTDGRFVDIGTGSEWTPAGVAVPGDPGGTTLEAVPSRTTFWFAFIGAFPEAELYES